MTVSFNAADAAVFVNLASKAALDLSELFLDPPWRLVQTFRSNTPSHAQGFIAAGPLPSDPNVTIAVVALGAGWSDFLETYLADQHQLSFPPSNLFPPGTPGFPMADLGYTNMYGGVRSAMWTEVLFAKRTVPDFQSAMPAVVCGIGPGAPLAQFAAVDLLPGHVWNGNTSPLTSMTAYTFSNVAFGDQGFANAIDANVPAAFAVNLATSAGVNVDPYPLQSSRSDDYVRAGQQIGANAKLPQGDCPWLERSPGYYEQTLRGGSGAASSSGKKRQSVQRRGFSAGVLAARNQAAAAEPAASVAGGYVPTLAYTLTLLDLAAYHRALHPDLPLTVPPPYTFARDIKAGRVNWGSLYVSPDRVVAAFRGTATWQETVDAWGTTDLVRPQWLDLEGELLTGPSVLYDALRDDLRAALVAIQQSHLPLVLTGHDIGGSLASLAMLDLTVNPLADVPVASAVYTFGAPPLGDLTFASSFDTTLGASSFQVVRPNDIIPQLVFGAVSNAVTVPDRVLLQGGSDDPALDPTFHTLTSYSQLLDPQAAIRFDSAPLTASEQQYFEAGQGDEIRINEITKCVLDSANSDGRLVFSWEAPESKIPPKRSYHRGQAYIGGMQTIVRPGHEMLIEAPQGQKVHVVLSELVLSPGATVRVATNARLHVGRLTVPEPAGALADTPLPPPRIVIVGTDGQAGQNGIAGAAGTDGAPHQAGGQGSNGGNGGAGRDGGNAVDAEFSIGTVTGTFVVFGRGGNGGAGGGGAGGPSIGIFRGGASSATVLGSSVTAGSGGAGGGSAGGVANGQNGISATVF